jgi:hypothetical protein
MKKSFIVLLFLSLTLTSCIEIIEEFTINSDQSGSISYRLEMGELSSMLKRFTGFTSNIPEAELKEKIEGLAKNLEHMDGINNVNYITDAESGEFVLNADFTDPKSLNQALYQTFGYEKKIFTPEYIRISNHKFKRTNLSPWIKNYLKSENIELPEDYLLDLISIRTIVNLPDEVKKFRPSNAKISKDKNQVSILYPIAGLIENQTSMGLRIKY